MTFAIKRNCLLLLSFVAGLVGIWAGFFPMSFYENFPLPGWGWVWALGPYNEHLVRDYGLSNLALLVITLGVWRKPSEEALKVVGGGWLAYSSFHFLWHMFHLGAFDVVSRVGAVVALSIILAASAVAMVPARTVKASDVV